MPFKSTFGPSAECSSHLEDPAACILSLAPVAKRLGRFLEKDIVQIGKRTNDRLIMPLSGGLDSSILAKIALKHRLIDETFSTGYPFADERQNLEEGYAYTAAEAFGTKHRYYSTTT